jgi:hypothetical protein
MAVDIQDPRITRTTRTGYPEPIKMKPGKDAFDNNVYPGDEILEIDDVIFLKEELLQETIDALKMVGAEERIAE